MSRHRITTLKQAQRVIAAVVGFTLLVPGFLMLFLPGPGLLTIFLGLGVLGGEFVWARRLYRRVKKMAQEFK